MPERGSKKSTVPVDWATFGIFSARSKWFPVGRDWWPWTKPGYITMARRQSNNQWSGGIEAHPVPKKFRVQKSAGKVLASIFLGSRRHLPIDYLSKGQTINAENYSSLLVQLKDTLRKNAARSSCSCTTMPQLTRHLQPRRNWPTWASVSWSPTLFSGSGPVGLPPVLWTEKTIKRSPFFFWRGGYCCRRDLVGRRIFWIFLSGLQKKSNELRSVFSFVRSMLNKSRVWSL